MTLAQFGNAAGLADRTLVERVKHLAFYHLKSASHTDFTLADVSAWCEALHFAKPNPTRLKQSLVDSRDFVRGSKHATFRLHARAISTLSTAFPDLGAKSESIAHSDAVLPLALLAGTRGYLESLARQINVAFEQNLFDACAVLMRRLIEVLLIHSYEANNIVAAITLPDGSFKSLNSIIDDAEKNATLGLSKGAKSSLDTFRTLGNFSAHKIHYTARRGDLAPHTLPFRASVEELLYKSGIRT